MASRIMAHLVAGYPDLETSLEAARALTDGGCAYLEVQFPFSDPTADGPVIQAACDRALRAGFRLAAGFALVAEIRRFTTVPILIMSYANPVFVRGTEGFLREAQRAGAAGVIVPDLPVDADEGLFEQARRLGLHAVPVASPNASPRRLELVRESGARYVYATLRPGITGTYTEIGPENLAFLRRLAALGLKVLAGFGISTREQVQTLEPHVHATVVGSVLVREIRRVIEGAGPPEALGSQAYATLLSRLRELTGS